MTTKLRYLAILEATTYLLLLSALIWRTVGDGPDLSSITGPLHGLVFVAYCAAVLIERADQHWRASTTALALFAAIIPLGGYFVAHRLLQTTEEPSS